MGAFEYSAVDSVGKIHKGVKSGDSPRQIRQNLRDQGLMPVSVEAVTGEESRRSAPRWRKKPKTASLALVMRQLATMVKSGAVLGEALNVVSEQTDQVWAKKVFVGIMAHVQEGMSLAAAMAEFPEVFPDLYRATIEAGEHTGRLDLVLERLADYTEFRQHLQQKITLALAYPLLLSVVAVLVVVGLLGYVVPQIVTVFTNINQELPILTRIVIRLSEFFREQGLILFFLLIAGVIVSRLLMKNPGVRVKVHGLLITAPLVGRFMRGLEVARFARTYSILVASGVSALEGLKIAAGVVNNLVLKKAIEKAAQGVREGKTISKSLAATKVFPPMVIYLIASGEASADLAQMLDQAASSQEKEVEVMTGLATAIFEPMLILLMGGLVLMIVLAILMPVFELNQLVR
ncbi:MAG: type II secretion system inner membrane protein GspF [Desulfobulbaceae bacterium]|nr:type II secretion system inner membrane protein GspF [Desulfobulbaceae bacterium]